MRLNDMVPRQGISLLPLVVALTAGLAACSGGPAGDGTSLPEPVCPASSEGTPAPEFVGLTDAEADELASEQGWVIREIGRDGSCADALTADLRQDRVNLEFANGVVIAAAIY